MSKQHWKVIRGGSQETPVARQSATDVPLKPLHATLVQAYTPLQEKVNALGTDWDTRPSEFWQEILTALPRLREAVQPCIEYTVGDSLCSFSLAFISIRYSLLGAFYRALNLIDDAGIAVTSYKPVCLSREVRHLHQRHHALETLRKLVGEVRTGLDLLGSQIPNNTGQPSGEEQEAQQ